MNETPCPSAIPTDVIEASDDNNDDSSDESNGGNSKQPRHKRDSALKDQQSTGRKRAAVAYPLDKSARCQWADASSENPMGGGEVPIPYGCDNLQQCRHHGPDYNTLSNERGNVWLICNWHHNNWHSMNNPFKDENYLKQYGHGAKVVTKQIKGKDE